MSDNHDNRAAAKVLADWCHATDQQDAWLQPKTPGVLGEVYRYGIRHDVTTAHVRAVLAENETMRRALGLVAEEVQDLPEICSHLVGPRCGEAVDRAREARSLVGEWQPAEGGEKP